jgi:hypothetical protein
LEGAGTEEYLLVVSGDLSLPPDDDQSYTVTPNPITGYSSRNGIGPRALDGERAGPRHCLQSRFLRPQYDVGGKSDSRTPGAVALQDTMAFFVLNCVDCSFMNPASYSTVTAHRVFDGTRIAIYSDIDQPSGSFGPSEYLEIGLELDTTVFPTNEDYFGSPTDINDDNRVVVLFTPLVNTLALPIGQFIAGFFLSTDLLPGPPLPPGTSNGMEIIYSFVPDPQGEYGLQQPKQFVRDLVPVTVAHEGEHLIDFGYRVFHFGVYQTTWLAEGLGHMAEDLNGFDDGNVRHANIYLRDPGAASFLDPMVPIGQRGAIFLLLRYMGDRFGEGIYKSIVQSDCIGTECLEDASGLSFRELMRDFMATLYLSDRGITSNPAYRFTSFNLQADFEPLLVAERAVTGGPFSGTTRSAAGDFYTLGGFVAPGSGFTVESSPGYTLRLILYRLQ